MKLSTCEGCGSSDARSHDIYLSTTMLKRNLTFVEEVVLCEMCFDEFSFQSYEYDNKPKITCSKVG